MSGWVLGPYRAVGHRFVVQGDDADQVRRGWSTRWRRSRTPTAEPTGTYQVTDHGSDAVRRGTRCTSTARSCSPPTAPTTWPAWWCGT